MGDISERDSSRGNLLFIEHLCTAIIIFRPFCNDRTKLAQMRDRYAYKFCSNGAQLLTVAAQYFDSCSTGARKCRVGSRGAAGGDDGQTTRGD